MKNLNKVLAMLVVFMMVVSTVAFASFTDVAEDSTYNVAVKVGTDLGLFTGYEDGSFKPEGEITRAEFAAIVVRMKGQEAQAEGAKSATMFTDVPADHWAAGYINIAVRLGIINGYGDGNFGPSDLVEYQDAITMMVRALGYEPAIGAAGYPTGYLTKAGDLGLTANVSGVNGVAINRGKVAQIVFNALDVALMTQSGYGTFTQYVVNDGYSSTNGTTNTKKTILSENHSIVKVQGIVLSSSLTTNATNTGSEKVDFDVTNAMYNKFNIGDGNMEVAESGASAYVGKKVIAFVHYNEFTGVKTIVSLYDAPVADELVVALQDLDVMPDYTPAVVDDPATPSVDESAPAVPAFVGNFSYTYYNENGRSSSVTAAKYDASTNSNIIPDVYINGVNWTDVSNKTTYDSAADLNKLCGTITFALLDTTNTTADYDTIYIDAAMPFVVDDVKVGNSTVKGKAIGTLNRINFLEEDGVNEATLYGADGAEMDWADLEENDVLMVKYVTTANKNLYEASLVENTVEGKVDGLAGVVGAPTREITIGGVAYKVAGDVETNVTAIKANDEGIFYLDANDNIVYFDVTSSVSRNYGYVIDTAAPQAGNFLSGYQMQILTKDNTVVVFDLYKKIKYNANSGLEVVGTAAGDGTVGTNEIGYSAISGLIDTVITYNVNSANEITAIFTPGTKSTTDDEDLDSTFTYDDTFAPTVIGGVNYLAGFDPDDSTFGKYSIDENTVIFLVEANGTAKDRKKAEVVAVPVLEEDDRFSNPTLYNVDADDYINCIVVRGTNSVIGGQSESATFVLKVAEGTDEEGNTIYTVTGYKDCEVVTYTVDDASILKNGTTNINFYVGKLVVPEFEVNGDVKGFKHTGNVTTPVGGALAERRFATVTLGTTGKIDGNKLLTKDATDTNGDGIMNDYTQVAKIKAGANVYVYDSRKAASGRGFYQIDADGYLDWDETDGIYYGTNAGEKNLNVTATIFYTDTTDAVDVLFYIN